MLSKPTVETGLHGAQVDATPAKRPQRTMIEGCVVSIVPLDPSAHAETLFDGTSGQDNAQLWRYLFDGPFSTRAAFDSYVSRKATSEDPLFFAILDKLSGHAVGHAAYYAHRAGASGDRGWQYSLYTSLAADCWCNRGDVLDGSACF